jgi:mono/diheme cytochrome c family protein
LRRSFAAIVAGCAVAALAAGCGSVGHVEEPSTAGGQQLFQENCGSCHTLADAGTQGQVGPNLDQAFAYARKDQGDQGFQESTIRDVVRGQIAYPVEDPPTGDPGMPANILTGEDADIVASYVASVAGLPVAGGGQATGGGATAGKSTDGKTVFASAGCSSCHTLAAADATGNVGPNLDEAKPPMALVVDRVTNGKGPMPSFKGTLSPEQIQAVAKFVSENAGKG